MVDCISRVLYLDNDFSNELNTVKKQLKLKQESLDLEGVLSLGEISSMEGGFLEFLNKTIVVGAFHT
jgi:hypothetical protein